MRCDRLGCCGFANPQRAAGGRAVKGTRERANGRTIKVDSRTPVYSLDRNCLVHRLIRVNTSRCIYSVQASSPNSSELALCFHTRRDLCPLGLDWQIQTGELYNYVESKTEWLFCESDVVVQIALNPWTDSFRHAG